MIPNWDHGALRSILAITAPIVLLSAGDKASSSDSDLARKVLHPEVMALTDSVRVLYDSLEIGSVVRTGRMSSDWTHEPPDWNPPWAAAIELDEPDSGPIWTWLTNGGWEQANGSDRVGGSIVWWVRGPFGCEVHETWGPSDLPGDDESEPAIEEELWHTCTISFCVADSAALANGGENQR